MTLGAWLSVVVICALGAASPGPSLAVVLRHSMDSRAQGIACALGHAVGIGAYALVMALGLAAVLESYPAIHGVVALAGALYLLWLGIGALRAERDRADAPAAAARADHLGAARDGFAIALLNPKVAAFFLALFSQFVDPEPDGSETTILWATAASIDAIWYTLVALVFSGSRAIEWLRGHHRALYRATGVLLIALAVWTLVRLAVALD